MSKYFCIGCGSSLKGFDFNRLKGLRTIGTNRILIDFPDVESLVFLDLKFFEMYKEELRNYRGMIYTTERAIPDWFKHKNMNVLETKLRIGKDSIAGGLSGLTALNLACLFAEEVYLLGYDMYHGHYYSDAPDLYDKPLAKKFNEKFRELKELFPEVSIYNCNPDSALTCFEYRDINKIK